MDIGRHTSQLTSGNVISYLQFIVESFEQLAKEKEIDLRFSSNCHSLIAEYDEKKLQHIMYNLISNATKFTEINGFIAIRADKKELPNGRMLIIDVEDNGIGIPQKVKPYIFNNSSIFSARFINLAYSALLGSQFCMIAFKASLLKYFSYILFLEQKSFRK